MQALKQFSKIKIEDFVPDKTNPKNNPELFEPYQIFPMQQLREEFQYDMKLAIYRLMSDEPLFCHISKYMRKVADYRMPSPAGVRFNHNLFSFELRYNPIYFALNSEKTNRLILIHEFLHIILGHLSGGARSSEWNEEIFKLVNFAIDFAVNSHDPIWTEFAQNGVRLKIPCATKDGKILLLEDYGFTPGVGDFKDIPRGLSAEEYLELIKTLKEEIFQEPPMHDFNFSSEPSSGEQEGQGKGGNGEDGGNQDGENKEESEGNSPDSSGTEMSQEFVEGKLKNIVRRAMNEAAQDAIARGKGWGSFSQELRELVLSWLESKLSPEQVFRNIINKTQRHDKRSSITKINRRWAYIHPGKRWNRIPNILVMTDESGSVSNELISMFYGWMRKLSKFATFTRIPFDHEVFEDEKQVFIKGKKFLPTRHLCGGTDFDAPTRYFNEHAAEYDALVILTDMQAPKPGFCKKQRIWITDKEGRGHMPFSTSERVLCLDE